MTGPIAALGLRAHSGWAALVAVAGTRRAIEVVDRRRVSLADPSVAGPKQPYHEAEGESLARARRTVEGCADEALRRAGEALRAALDDLRAKGHKTVGCGLLQASDKPLPRLESILASHALIHRADGELFRDALAHAAESCGLALTRVREREIFEVGTSTLRLSTRELQNRLVELGRPIGPPWTQDQKLSTAAAWLALAQPEGSRD